MTTAPAHPPAQLPARPVLELVVAETPAAGWSDLGWSELGEPLAEAAVLGCLLRTTPEHVAAPARALLEQGHPIDR